MTRQEIHLDAMLRHLGAAYYDSLHGRAAGGEVRRALAGVDRQLGDEPAEQRPGPPDSGRQVHKHHGKLHCRVRDVMATNVITIDLATPFKEVASVLVERRISGVPVLMSSGRLAGMVTEGDLLRARDRHVDTRRRWTGVLRYGTDRDRYARLTAEQLMTSPPVTIHPDASIGAASDVMSLHRVRRLPVAGADGQLLGVVSRRDLLKVFLVPDEEIERQATELLAEIMPEDQPPITASVRGGILTLTGQLDAATPRARVGEAIDLAWDIDGVVDIIDHTGGEPAPAP
ncbi:MAG TPA: CBS domain-containing protein [Streptosporangiaceae bacterium]|nr:CBS domain-containing protein [Streptosporangiaceae bacterium]